MEHAKALVLVEKRCYIAAINRIYQNPPLETSTLDCIAAKRRLPCSLCADRDEISLNFDPSPLPRGVTLPPFTPAVSKNSTTLSAAQKKLKLTRKERKLAETALTAFGETVRIAERKHITNQNRPKSSFFPTSVSNSILDKFLSINSLASLTVIIESWLFSAGYAAPLYNVVEKLQTTMNAQRKQAKDKKNAKQRATRSKKTKKWVSDSEEELEEESEQESEEPEEEPEENLSGDGEAEEHRRSSPIPPPPKRTKTALTEVTNQERPTRRTRAPREKQQSLATVSATLGPGYRPRTRAPRN